MWDAATQVRASSLDPPELLTLTLAFGCKGHHDRDSDYRHGRDTEAAFSGNDSEVLSSWHDHVHGGGCSVGSIAAPSPPRQSVIFVASSSQISGLRLELPRRLGNSNSLRRL